MSAYGPDAVTSRPFSRCPAAQIRSASPATRDRGAGREADRGVGRASHSASAPTTKPSGTRYRASRRTSSDVTARPIAGVGRRRDVRPSRCWIAAVTSATPMLVETPRRLVAAAIVVAAARLVPRHHHVVRRPGTVALADRSGRRARRSACRRRPRCAAGRCRPTRSARPRATSATRSATLGRRRAIAAAPPRRRRPPARAPARQAPTARPTASPRTSRRNAATSPNRSGGQRLFGHAAPGLISANGAGADRRRGPRRAPATPVARAETRCASSRRRRRAAGAGSCG